MPTIHLQGQAVSFRECIFHALAALITRLGVMSVNPKKLKKTDSEYNVQPHLDVCVFLPKVSYGSCDFMVNFQDI